MARNKKAGTFNYPTTLTFRVTHADKVKWRRKVAAAGYEGYRGSSDYFRNEVLGSEVRHHTRKFREEAEKRLLRALPEGSALQLKVLEGIEGYLQVLRELGGDLHAFVEGQRKMAKEVKAEDKRIDYVYNLAGEIEFYVNRCGGLLHRESRSNEEKKEGKE